MRKSKVFSILLCLTICVGCSMLKPQGVVVQEKHRVVFPPAALLQDPEPPVLVEVSTARHLLDNSDAFEAWGDRAVAQIRKLREWYAKQPAELKGE